MTATLFCQGTVHSRHRGPQALGAGWGVSALSQEAIVDTLRMVEYENFSGLLFTDVGGGLKIIHVEPNRNTRIEN